MLTILRTLFLILAGWYLVKWLAGWIAGGSRGRDDAKGRTEDRKYGELTDQKIEDADYEDL